MGYKLGLERANRVQLIAEVSKKTGLSRKEAQACLDAFFGVVKTHMASGTQVYVRGFGTFYNKKRAAKIGRHIKKNTAMMVEAHYVAGFKPSAPFAQALKTSPSLLAKIAEESKSETPKK